MKALINSIPTPTTPLFLVTKFILAFFCTFFFTSCSEPPPEIRPIQKINETSLRISASVLQNIKSVKAILLEMPEQLNLMGKINIIEDQTAVVPARAAGRIDSVKVASGEYAVKDQLLAYLYSPDFISAREEYLQSLKKTKTKNQTGISEDFDNLTQMAKKRLEIMGLNAHDIESLATDQTEHSKLLPVRSPRDGFLIAKNATIGSVMNLGDPLFTTADLKKVWFSGDLYPEDLPKVHKNQDVFILPGNNEPAISGKISFISAVVDPATRTIKIRALMNNVKNLLRADMYVQGSLTVSKTKALLVPSQSIIRSQNDSFIFRKISPNTIEKGLGSIDVQTIKVALGRENNGMTEIKEGVKEGEEVISEGALLLFTALNYSENSKIK